MPNVHCRMFTATSKVLCAWKQLTLQQNISRASLETFQSRNIKTGFGLARITAKEAIEIVNKCGMF